MTFVMTYSFPPENRQAVRTRFRETGGGEAPAGVKYLGRWNAIGDAKGVVIFESDDPVIMAKWIQQWSDLMSCEIYPAITNEMLGTLFA